MNIAIINTLAKTGSTGKITYEFQKFLKSKGHKAYIFYGRKDEKVLSSEKDIIRVGNDMDLYIHIAFSRIKGMQGTYSKKATKKMLSMFEKLNIQAVCMFNLHGYYLNFPILFQYLKEKKIFCEYVMLDEYPFLGRCTYSFECEKFKDVCKNCPRIRNYPRSLFVDDSMKLFNLKKKTYALVPQCTFVGIEYTVNRAKKSMITAECKFGIADEAVNLKEYYPRDTTQLRKKLKIPASNKVIVTVTPYPDDRKGGKYFLEAAKRLTSRTDITFVHVGFNAEVGQCPSNYIPIGYVSDQNLLAEYYSLGDLFVHTSMADTIPAAIIEALACGTHIMGFNASGIPYSADNEHGVFVEPKNVDEMVRVIIHTPRKNKERIQSCRKYAESRYDSFEYGQKLLEFLK